MELQMWWKYQHEIDEHRILTPLLMDKSLSINFMGLKSTSNGADREPEMPLSRPLEPIF